ncbi:MAG TPA: hypothetical protein VHM19_10530, partial [Polyangiales bacterium]|nr:hypothetical protein [Polyangiales bacterium]
MAELSVNESAAGGLAVAPSLTPLAPIDLTNPPMPVDARVVAISGVAMGVAVLAGLVSRVLARLIDFFTNLAFYGRF